MKTEYLVVGGKESVLQSLIKDAITFGFLAFCIWISHGSRGWSIICALMFFTFLCMKMVGDAGSRIKRFKSKKELIDWANANPDQ